jgi:hypothetical protein
MVCLTDAWDQSGRAGKIFDGQEGDCSLRVSSIALFRSSRWITRNFRLCVF